MMISRAAVLGVPFCIGWCVAALAALQTGAWGELDPAGLQLVVVPERTYVEPWPEQIGLNDRVSLHFVVLNDTSEEVVLEGVRISFEGAEGCAYEMALSRDALAQRLRECASAVFVDPGVREHRTLATEPNLPPGAVAALIGTQFDIPAAIRANEATIEVRARGEQGRDRSLRATVKLWRYEPTTRFQFPFEGVWQVVNGHGPGPGHPVDSFAYDLMEVRGLSHYEGDGARHEQWWGYATPIVAAADGVVVEANQAAGIPERLPFSPYASAEELGLKGHVITNTLVTIDRDGVHYRPGSLQWEALTAEEKARINGAHVTIRHSEEEYSYYVHLQPGSLTVEPGDHVKAGEQIGKCGCSGNANAPGLHFQVLYRPDMHAGLPVAFTPAEAPDMAPLRLQVFGTYEN